MENEAQSWERQRNEDGKLESNLWFDRFTRYRLLGASRSLLGCVNDERVTKGNTKSNQNYTPGSWRRAFKIWHWAERVKVWDEFKRAEDEKMWDDRRRDVRAADWKASIALRERAEQMRKFPLAQIEKVEKVYPDGRVKAVTIVHPVRWSQADLARFEKVASDLARLAAEMEQTRAAVDVTTKGKKIVGLTDEERLAAITAISERISKETD